MPEDRKLGRTALCCVLLALLTISVYWPVVRLGFINYDDPDYVSGNPRVQAGLTAAGAAWAFTNSHSSNWHPVTWLSHMLDCQLYGLKAGGHHLTNLLFHTANTLLLFGLLIRMTRECGVRSAEPKECGVENAECGIGQAAPPLAFSLQPLAFPTFWLCAFVAALFALHPLHVESVAWISERKDVLSGFFFLLTIWAYVRYAEKAKGYAEKAEGLRLNAKVGAGVSATLNPQPSTLNPAEKAKGLRLKAKVDSSAKAGSRFSFQLSAFSFHASAFYLLSLTFFVLGLMSKPMLVTLPFVLLLLDYWPLGRFHLRDSSHFSLKPLAFSLLEKLPFFALSAVSCVVTFLVQQAAGATVPLASAPVEVRFVNALMAYASYLGKTIWPTRLAVFYPYVRFDLDSWQVIAALLLLAAITAGAVWLRKQRPYLLVGWLWFLGMLVPVIGLVQVGKQSMADRYTYLPHIGLFIALVWGAAALLAPGAPVSLPAQTLSHEQARRRGGWRSRWLGAATVALVLAGCAILTARQLACWRSTKTLFEHAAAATERNFVAFTVIASALAEQGQPAEALEWCRKSLEISPDYPEAHHTLGAIYAKLERYDDAVASYRKAAELDPSYPDPRAGLGSVLVKQGKFTEAESWCREALRLNPVGLPALFSLATALHNQGKLDEAADCYRRIITVDPKLFTPHSLLGKVLAAQGKTDEAVAELQLALKLRPNEGDTRTVLGVLLLGRGSFEEAAGQFSEAARLQPTNSLANYQLALIHQQRKETRAAIECLRKALRAQPDWPETLNNLAWLLASGADPKLRNGPEAVTLAERACQLTGGKEPLLFGTLAAAYAEAGRFPDAISSAEKARALALAAGRQDVAQRNQELLQLYRAGKAYHEAP
jgi:protein O-mannosyl-transferase